MQIHYFNNQKDIQTFIVDSQKTKETETTINDQIWRIKTTYSQWKEVESFDKKGLTLPRKFVNYTYEKQYNVLKTEEKQCYRLRGRLEMKACQALSFALRIILKVLPRFCSKTKTLLDHKSKSLLKKKVRINKRWGHSKTYTNEVVTFALKQKEPFLHENFSPKIQKLNVGFAIPPLPKHLTASRLQKRHEELLKRHEELLKFPNLKNTQAFEAVKEELEKSNQIHALMNKYGAWTGAFQFSLMNHNYSLKKINFYSSEKPEFYPDPGGPPQLLDALFTGCSPDKAISTYQTYTDEIENDIKTIIKLMPESIHCRVGKLKCRDEVTPLMAACINEVIPLSIVQLLLQNGADPEEQIKVNDQPVKIIDDLKEEISNERYNAIKELFEKYKKKDTYLNS